MATKQGYGKSGQAITTLNLMMGGKNTHGKAEDVKSIEFTQEEIDNRGTGIWSPDKFSATIMDLHPSYVRAIEDGEPFMLKGNINEDGKNIPYKLTLTIEPRKISTELKEGEYAKRSFEGTIMTYREVINGEQTIKYNRQTMLLDFGNGNVMENVANNTN